MNTQNPLPVLSIWTLAIFFWATSNAYASSATLVGVYQDCQYVTSSVFVVGPEISVDDKASAVAAVESAIIRYGFEGALLHASKTLKHYGIEQVEVERQGFAGCRKTPSGKFVQAIGNYCGGNLVSAEIRVDDKIILKKTGDLLSFDAFVNDSLGSLRRQGIWDRPHVEVNSAGNCESTTSSNRS